ncbi:MAG: diguanylate cyclase [Gemmatimonadetes bacterium]|nr:diguanylate cyclase [Gemmatimonadota bacterium]
MRPRVLVAEDEETLRTVIREVLEDAGFPVTAVPSAEQALEEFRKEPFPIVLTDIVMHQMTGLQLLEEVKMIDQDTVVVVMTSHASLDSATRALRSGAYDFMVKPFEQLDIISSTVERAREKAELVGRNRRLTEDLKHQTTDLSRANTALIQLADSLKDYANKDGLTGLFNHRLFREALNRELARAKKEDRPLSIIFMDVDHFKNFNDSNGHLAGDDVLRKLAELTRTQVEKPGMVARYGGEELVALVPGATKDEARLLAEQIREVVASHPFEGRERQPLGKVTLSLGIASFPGDGDDSETIIDHADQAVYLAKDGGRNQVCG